MMRSRFQAGYILPPAPMLPIGQRRQLRFISDDSNFQPQSFISDTERISIFVIRIRINENTGFTPTSMILTHFRTCFKIMPFPENFPIHGTVSGFPFSRPDDPATGIYQRPSNIHMIQPHMRCGNITLIPHFIHDPEFRDSYSCRYRSPQFNMGTKYSGLHHSSRNGHFRFTAPGIRLNDLFDLCRNIADLSVQSAIAKFIFFGSSDMCQSTGSHQSASKVPKPIRTTLSPRIRTHQTPLRNPGQTISIHESFSYTQCPIRQNLTSQTRPRVHPNHSTSSSGSIIGNKGFYSAHLRAI